MEKSTKRIGATDVVLLVFTILSVIGLLTVFKGCGPKEDGTWMTCHWAEVTEVGLGIVFSICAVLHLLIADGGVKKGIDLAIIPTALLAVNLPDFLISLCMANTMRCHVFTRPFILVINILIIVTCIVDIFTHKNR